MKVVRVGQVHLFYRARLLSPDFNPGHETIEARGCSRSRKFLGKKSPSERSGKRWNATSPIAGPARSVCTPWTSPDEWLARPSPRPLSFSDGPPERTISAAAWFHRVTWASVAPGSQPTQPASHSSGYTSSLQRPAFVILLFVPGACGLAISVHDAPASGASAQVLNRFRARGAVAWARTPSLICPDVRPKTLVSASA